MESPRHPEVVRTNRYGSLVVDHDYSGRMYVYWQNTNGVYHPTGVVDKLWWERSKPHTMKYQTIDGQMFDTSHEAAEHVLSLANREEGEAQ